MRASERLRDETDSGLTLVEVLVAMMVFAVIAVGVAFSLTSSLALTRDGSARQTAANLVASEIDYDRSVADVFSVGDMTRSAVVGGTTYRLTRATNWVSSGGSSAQCGSGGGALQYKRITVSVTWNGMRSAGSTVQADTLIAPNTRINDPSLGTILVSVLNAAGTGSAGVAVTATPNAVAGNTAQPITVAPLATDAQGCSYILKVTPGTYDVTISKSGYVTTNQSLNSATITVGVSAGTSASAGFQFDQAGQFTVQYAANYTSGPVTLPTNLDTTFVNTYGTFVQRLGGAAALLHPFPSGYQVIAGNFIDPTLPSGGCKSVDPGAWNSTVVGGVTYASQRAPAVAASPGGSATMPVSMGVATVTTKGVGGTYLNAVSLSSGAGTGDPGCAVTTAYTFGSILSSTTTRSFTVALPFGTWLFYTSSTETGTSSAIPSAAFVLKTRGVNNAATNAITFDPRTAGG